jgi:hypothetical protein
LVDLDLNLKINNAGGISHWVQGDSWQIIDWGSVSLLNRSVIIASQDLPLLGEGLVWDTNDLAIDGLLRVVPEPSRVLLICLGTAFLIIRRRKR